MKKLLLSLLAIVCSVSMWAGDDLTASFSLASYTVSDGKATITSSDNTNVSLLLARNSGNIGNPASSNRGFRVQNGMNFTITVPEGKYITKVEFTSGSNGNFNSQDNVGLWSITGESSTWKLAAKQDVYTWTNGGTNLSSPMKFENTSAGDIYVSAVKVYYNDAPELEDEAPTISIPTSKSGDTKHSIQITATVGGVPTPSIQWYSNTTASTTGGEAIVGATSSSYSFTPTTGGTYYFYAVASNTSGDVTSNVCTVTVTRVQKITFTKDADVIGTVPEAMFVSPGVDFTMPVNTSLYKADYTLTAWNPSFAGLLDPGATYNLDVTTINADGTVAAKFTANTKTLADVKADTEVKFISASSPNVTYQSSTQNAVVQQVTVDGEKIDVAMLVQGGKLALDPAGPRAQTNNGTKLTIPVTDGTKIKLQVYHNVDTPTWEGPTINGESISEMEGTVDAKIKTVEYTYNGSAESIDYVVTGDKYYLYEMTATYPVQSDLADSNLDVATKTKNFNKDDEGAFAYTTTSTGAVTAESSDEDVVTVTVDQAAKMIEFIAKKAGTSTITISQAADDTYKAGSVQVTFNVTDPYAPDVVAKWDATDASKIGTWTYSPSNVTSSTVKINTNTNTVNAIKCASSIFKDGVFTNYAKVVVDGGFKAGDIVSVSGVYNADGEKEAKIAVSKDDATSTSDFLYTSTAVINGRTEAADPEVFTFVLTEDCDHLCVGRGTGGTSLFITKFEVSRPKTVATPSINAQGFGTFSCAKNVQIVGAKVYAAKANTAGDALVLTEVESGKVPAGTGVLLYKEGTTEATTAKALYADAADEISATINDLMATTRADGSLATKVESLALSGNTFMTYDAATYVANKAYLPSSALPLSLGGAKLAIIFAGEETTAVNKVATVAEGTQARKAIVNGRLMIVTANGMYTPAGALVK